MSNLETLAKEGMKFRNAHVMMMGDNRYRHEPLSGQKQPRHAHQRWAWQGGIRAPMIVRGRGQGHQRLYNEMMHYFEEVGARIPKKNPDCDQ
jgi:arylsulfatase A-like enzyme